MVELDTSMNLRTGRASRQLTNAVTTVNQKLQCPTSALPDKNPLPFKGPLLV
jgi:hypothetical protein